ncbi:MAG: nitrate/nitrite transporter NrtS [Chloroflexota bacterium]|nr:nitrate/nitrite transporter NrtS [Chloroflexota bacterium]
MAFVVGTILTLLNQGDTVFATTWDKSLCWKIPLTYCVPFLVATYGALSNGRQ